MIVQKISLNGQWDARIDPEENGLAQNWAKKPIESELKVNVPGCIQQLDELADEYEPHNSMRNGYKGTFFLEKTFELEALKKGEHCRLYLGGVIPSCHIWVNGVYALKNILGLCHITPDITDLVIPGKNRVTVAVTEQYESLISGMRFAGMSWSGIYSEAYVEISGALEFKNYYIAQKNGKAFAEGKLQNNGETDFSGVVSVEIGDKCRQFEIAVKKGECTDFSNEIDINGLPRWSYRNPTIVEVSYSCLDNNGNKTVLSFKTGLREITVNKDRIEIDSSPTFFKGTGSEYYSPTISPLTDRRIIENRFAALKAHGFNFYRCHTHVPTEEEMCIADEYGIMLDVELGLISNFNKTTPIEKGMEILKQFILETRRHPSVMVYCLGNEGSQLMVDSYIERNRAKMGYKLIKENTANQLGIIAFGLQGELPELPNDFETPHLWSENFLWSYDGLTDIPWEELGRTTGGKPCIIHEYGKFGVWPSLKEEQDCTVEKGIKPDHGTQSHEWLIENGLESIEQRLIDNSRKSAVSFNRIILEDARRQTYVSGYALWTFFRRSGNNAGLSDDLGINFNGDPALFRDGVNADIALLMDRGFQNRAFACNVPQEIEISVSNFSANAVSGCLEAVLKCGNSIIESCSKIVTVDSGVTEKNLKISFAVPCDYSQKKLELKATFKGEDVVISQNSWDLWAFDISAENQITAYLNIEDLTLFRAIKKVFPNAQRLSSVDSVIIGCRSWRDPRLSETAEKNKSVIIISDTYNALIKQCIENGNKVLLLDSGKLPDSWMLTPICKELGERDTGRFFTSFRSGWDKGNLVTIVEDDKILGNFPNEGFCDLHYYDMIQSARIMIPSVIEQTFGAKAKHIIESVSKIPVVKENESIVQDPNAIKEQKGTAKRSFNAREQGYLLKISKRLAVCTLKLSDNPAGIGLLKNMMLNFD